MLWPPRRKMPARIERPPIARMLKTRDGDSPKHLDFVRLLWCAKCGRRGCDPHHPKLMEMGSGKDLTAEDRWAFPLCRGCHTVEPWARHNYKGHEIDWCGLYGIQFRELGSGLWRNSGDDDQAFKLLGMYGATAIRGTGVMVR